jgi:hypothetical protein
MKSRLSVFIFAVAAAVLLPSGGQVLPGPKWRHDLYNTGYVGGGR